MSRPAVPPPVLVDPDMDQEVDRFLFVTGLRDSSDRSDEAFEAIVNGPQLAVSRSDNNLSLSHPKMSALLDDLDERLRRYVRYYRLADVEYSRREDREMKEQENEDSAERQITKRTRQMYGEAIIQGEEETERQIQDKKLSKQSLPPPSTALVLGILRVQALLLSHCAKPHLFNSTDRLLALLNSDDPTLLMASLYVLFQLQSTSSRQLTFQSFQARYVHGISPTTAMPHSSTIHVKNLLFTLANGVWGMREGSAEFNHASRSSKKPESTKPVVDDDEDMEEKKEEKKEDLKRQNSKKQKSSSSNKAKSQPLSTASEESPAKRRKGSKKKHLVDSPAAPATSNVFSSSSTTSSVNEEKLELHPLLTASPSLFPAREPVAPLPSLRSYVSPSSAPTQLSPTAKQIYALLSYKSPQQIQQDMQKFEREFGTAFVFPRIGGESNTNHAEHSAHGTGTSVSSSSPPPSVLTLSFLLQLYEKHAANFRSVCDFVLTLASPSLAAAANLPCYAIPPKHFFTLGFVLRYLLHYPSLDMRRKFLSIRLLSIQLLMTFSGQRKDVVEQIAHFDSLVIEGLVHIMRSDHVDILPPSLHNTTTNYPHLIQLIEGVSYPSSSAATAFLPSPSSTAYCLPHSLRAMSILTLQSLAASPSICRELQQTGILQHGVLLTLVKQSLANLTTFFSPPAGTTPPAVINPQQPLWWLSPTDLHFAACSVILTDCLFSFVQRLIPKAPYQSALLNHQEVLEIMVEVLRDRKVMQTTIFWRAAHIIEMCHHHSMSAITPRLQALQVADVLVDRLTDLISVRPFLSSVDGLTVESMDFNADTGNTSSSAAPTVSSSTPSAASDSTPPYSLPASSLFQVSPSYDFQPGVTVKALMPCVINSRKSVIIKMLYLLAGIIRHDREPVKLKSLKEGKLTALIKQLWLQSYDWKNTPKMFHANNLDSQSASSAAIPSNVTSSSSLSLSSPNSQARKRKGEEENPSTSATDAVVPVAASTSTDVAANSSKRQKLGSHSDDTHWGEQVYVTACQLVIGLAQNNPASVKQLYTDGLVRTFIDTLAYDVSGSLTAQCLPETLRTMCLHFESRDLILRNPARNPLKDLVLTVFLSQNPRHVIAVDVHMHVFAKSVEEFFRHYGRTTPTSQSTETATKDFMSFSHQLLELIRQQGKELERITALQSTDAAWVSAPVIGGIQLRPESFSQYSRRLLCFSKFLEIMLKNFGSNYLAAHGDKNLSAATQIQQQLRKFVLTMTNTAIERNLSPSLSGVFVGAKATEVIRNAAGELLNSNIATPSHSTPEAFSLKHVAFHNNSFISPIVILSNKPDYTPKIFAWLLERSVQVIKQCLSSPRQAGVATAKSALANSYLRFVDRDRKMEILSDDSLKPVLYRNTDFCGNLDLKVEFQQDELLAHELGELSAACWCSHLLSRLTRRLPISNFVTKQTPVEENDDASNTSPASPLSLSFADDLYLPLIEALRRVQAAIAHDQISTLQVSREMDAVNAQIKAEEKNALNTSSNDMCDVSSSIPPRKREFVFIRSNSSIATDLYHSALAKFNQYTWKLMGSLLKVAKTAENLGGSHTQVSKQSLEDSKKMYSFLATGIVNLLSIPDVPSPHRQGIPPTAFESSVWKLSPHLESHLFSLFYLKPVLKLVRILLYQSSNSVIHLATELNTSFLATIRQAGGGEKLLKMMRWAMMSRITLAKHMEAVANGSTDVNPTLAGSTVAHKEMLLAYDEILSEIGFFTEQLAKYDCETEKSDKQPSFAQSVSAAMASIMQQAHASQPSVTTTSAASPEAASSNNSTSVAASSSATTVTPASTSSTTSFPLSPSVYETAVSGASVIDDVKEKLSCLVLKECWGSPSSSPSNDSSMVDVGASSSSISSVAFHSLEYLPPAFVASILGVARRLTAAVIKAETAAASKAAKAKLASEKEEKEKEKEREKEKAKAEAAVATAAEGAQASTSAAAATASAASSANAASSTSATSTSAISSSSSSVPPPAAASATVSSASTSTSSAASSSATPSSTRPIRDGSLLSSVHESLITELISMGFSRAAAQASLLATQSTSPELNVEWLFSHAAEIEAIESEAAREASRVAQEAARVQQAIAAAESKKAASEKLAQALAEAAKTAETKIEVAKKTAWETYFGTNDMMKHVIQPLVASLSRFPSVAFHRDGLQSFPQVNQFDPHKTEPTSAMTSLVTSAATFMLTMSAATEIDIPSAFNQAFRQQMNDLMFNAIKQALEPLDAFPMPTQPNATNTVINSLTPAVVLNPCEVSMQRAHAVLQLYMMLLHEDANDQRDVDVAAFGPFLTTTLQRVFDWSQKADYVEYLNACRVSHESVKKRVELAKKSPPGDSKKQREERKEAMEEAIPPALNVMHQSFVNSLLVLSSLFLEEATLPQVTINELNGKDTKSDKKPISLPRPFAPLSSQRSLLNLSLQMLKAPLFQHDSLSYVCGVLVPLLHEKEFIDEFLSQGGLQSLVRLAGNEPPTTDDNKSKAPTVPSDFTLTPMYTLLHRLLSASSPQHHKYVIQTLLQALVCDLHRAMLRMRNQQLEEKATESLLLAGEVDAAIQSKSLQIEVIRNDHVITPSPPPAAASQHFLTPRVPFSPSLAGAIHPNNPRALQPATPLPPLVFQTPAKKGARGNNAAVVSAAQPTDHKADKGKAAKGNKKTEKKSTEEVISDSKKSGHAHKDKSKKSDSSEVASHPPLTPLSLDFHPLLHHAVLLRLLTYELDAEPHVLPYVWNFRPSQVNGVECAHTSLVSLLCQQFIIDPLQQFTSTVAICEFVLALCHYKPIKAKSSSKDKDEKKDKEEAKTAEAKESKEEKKQEKKESETASSSSSSKKSKGKQSKDKSVESSSTNNSAAAAASTSASDAASAIVPVPPAAPTALEMTRVIISEISMTLYVLICKGRPALASHLHPLHVNVPRHASAVLKAVHQHKQNSYLSMYTSDSACSSILHQKATASDAQPTAASESEPHLALRSVITSLTGLTNTLAAIMTRSTEAGASLHQHHRKIARILVDGNTHAVLCGVLAWMEFNAFSGTRLGITLVQGVTRLIETVVKLDAVFPLRASAKDSERNVRHKRHRKSKKKKRHGRGRDVVLFDDGHGGLITIDGLTGRGRRGDAPYVVHDGDELDGDGDEHDDEGDDELADAAAVNRLFAEIQAEQDAEDGLLPPNNANADDDEEVDDEALIQNAVEGEQDEEEEAAEEDEDEDDEMLMLDEDDMGSSDEDDDEDGEDDEGEDDEDDDDDDDGDDDDSDLGSIEDDDDVSESDVSDSEDEDEDEDDEVSNDEDEDGSNHSGSSDSVSEDEHSGNDNATEGDAADADAEVDADADADAADDAALDMDLLAEDEEDDLGSRSSGDSDDEDGFMDDLDAEDEIEFDGMRRGGGEDDDDGEQHVSGNIRFSQRDLSSHPLFRHLPPPPTNMRPQAAEAFRRILQGLAGTAGALDRELGSFRAAVGSNRSRETAALQSASDAAAQAIAAVERHLFSGAAGVAAESSAASTSASASASGSGAAVSTSTSSAPTSAAAATASTSSPAVPSASHSLSADEDLDETSAVDESFLAALPEELRQEILQQSSRSRRSTGNSAGSAAAVRNDEMASFQFLSYDYDTQEEILSQHPDPESFLFSLPSPAVAEILYQRHLREQGQRGSGPAAWRRMYYDYDDEGGAPEEKQQERKESESKQSEEKKKDTDADMGDDEDDSVEPKPLDAYPHVARCKELVFDRSSETHPHPLLCPSLLVPLIRVLYMSPINRATQVSAFRICDHVCVYQSTRHTLFSFVMALLRGLYTSAQTNDPMIKKMMDALPAGVMLGTKDDVTGTNLSTFSSASLSNADRAIGLPPVLSLRLFELLTHLSRRRNFGSAKFFFSPAHLTAASVELQSDDAMSESQLAHMQDLSQFSLQDAMTASPPIKPHASPLAVSKKQLKKDKKAGKKANQKESSPAFTSLGPAALQTSATSSVSPSTSPISPPPIIDLFALFGCRAVTSSRDHVKSLTYLLADIVSLPFQALDDLRTFRKGQEAKHKKRALAADSKDKLTSKTEAVGMDMDTDATASNDKKKTKSKETEDPNKKGKKAANSVSTVAATSSSSSSSSSSTFPVALLAEDDEKIWTDPTYPYPLPPCPILPSWCFSFLLSTLSIDGYPEKSLESIIRILLYFGERKKNRELIIREITTSIVTLSEGIQADMKTLVHMNATNAAPSTPNSADANNRKRKRNDAESDAMELFSFDLNTSTTSAPVETPISVSASTLMWSISQRESTLLRFVRILNTLQLIEPPRVADEDEKREENSSSPAAAASSSAASGATSPVDGKKDKDDDAAASNLTSLIKRPTINANSGMLSPASIAANKLLLVDLDFTRHMNALWSAMDSYFDIVEQRNTGFVVLLKSGGEEGKEGKETKDVKKEGKESDKPGTAKKDKTAGPSRNSSEKAAANEEAARKEAEAKAAALSKKLEDHRRDLTESDSSESSSTTRESDLLLLMHLPLIEAYFIFFAPRTQPKIHNSLSTNDRDKLPDKIAALEKSVETKQPVMDENGKPISVDSILASLNANPAAPTPAVQSASLSSFYAFTFKHRRPLNVALRQQKSLLQTSMRSLLFHPSKILDFDIRRKYFKNEIKKMVSKIKSSGHGGIKLYVRRDRIFEDSYQQLRLYKNKDDLLRSKLNIRFFGEDGLDAGGLAREWYLVLSRAIFNADNALFKPAADNPAVFQPNPESHINPDHLEFFEFAGRFVAKALMDNQRLDAYFTRSFYKHLLSVCPTYPDVESVDPEKAKSLQWMLQNSIEHIVYETFSVESVEFGAKKTVDLIPDGRNIHVTDANKALYVHLISEFILTRAIQQQLSAFLKGFHELIPAQLVSVFNEQELELMLCGLPDIDLTDLKKNIEYRGFGSDAQLHPVVKWFWEIISQFNQQEKALLVLFVTGTSKIPLEGFKALQGTTGVAKFTLQKANGVDGLPLAHTCFNTLDLGDYTSIDVMREKLMMALREGSQGFGFR